MYVFRLCNYLSDTASQMEKVIFHSSQLFVYISSNCVISVCRRIIGVSFRCAVKRLFMQKKVGIVVTFSQVIKSVLTQRFSHFVRICIELFSNAARPSINAWSKILCVVFKWQILASFNKRYLVNSLIQSISY